MKERYSEPQHFDAFVLTPNQTFIKGELLQYKRHWEVKLFLKEGADVRVGEKIMIKDILLPYMV